MERLPVNGSLFPFVFQRMKTLLLLTLAATLSFAGGFWIEKGNPAASKDPKAEGAYATVRAMGCHKPADAKFTALAVNEKHETRPVELVPLSTPGMYAVKQPPFREGQWTIVVTAEYGNAVTTLKLPLTPKS